MTDNDDISASITRTLHRRADGSVNVDALLSAAQTRGRTLHRRRQVWAAGLTTTAVLIGGAVAVTGGWPGGGSTPHEVATLPTPTPTQSPAAPLPLPPIVAEPGPHNIGDGRHLHISVDIDSLGGPINEVQWDTSDGLERLSLSVARGTVQLHLSRDKARLPGVEGNLAATTINGRPAEILVVPGTSPNATPTPAPTELGHRRPGVRQPYATIRWQPEDGLWAQVTGPGEDTTTQAARAARFDQVRRCAVPFRLTWVPPGATLIGCHFAHDSGRISVQIGDWYLHVMGLPPGMDPFNGDSSIGGHAAWVLEQPGDGGARIMQVQVDYGSQIADFTAEGRYDRQAVLQIAGGYQPATGTDPATWPVSPLP